MQKVDELKPCPFCGGRAHAYLAFPQFECGWHIDCSHADDCILRQAHGMIACEASESKAIDAWNRRATPSEGGAGALREALTAAYRHLALRPRGFDMPILNQIDAALSLPAAAEGWQTMESAPRDQTSILGIDGRLMFVCRWNIDRNCWWAMDAFQMHPKRWQHLPAAPLSTPTSKTGTGSTGDGE